jgi:hypothetical protein
MRQKRVARCERLHDVLRYNGPFSTLQVSSITTLEHPTMTRTPTTSVTAIAFAARAVAWNDFLDARLSGIASEIPLPLLR